MGSALAVRIVAARYRKRRVGRLLAAGALATASIVIPSGANASYTSSIPGMSCVPDGTAGYNKPNIGNNYWGIFNNDTSVKRSVECPIPARSDAGTSGAKKLYHWSFAYYDRNPNVTLDVLACAYTSTGSFLQTCTSFSNNLPGGTGFESLDLYPSTQPYVGPSNTYSLQVFLPQKYGSSVSHLTNFSVTLGGT